MVLKGGGGRVVYEPSRAPTIGIHPDAKKPEGPSVECTRKSTGRRRKEKAHKPAVQSSGRAQSWRTVRTRRRVEYGGRGDNERRARRPKNVTTDEIISLLALRSMARVEKTHKKLRSVCNLRETGGK
jgi:hypothetical protein